jgi:hypothetical protein
MIQAGKKDKGTFDKAKNILSQFIDNNKVR